MGQHLVGLYDNSRINFLTIIVSAIRAGADHSRTSDRWGRAHGGKRVPYGSERPYTGVKRVTQKRKGLI